MRLKSVILLVVALCMLLTAIAPAKSEAADLYPSAELAGRTLILHPVADNYADSKYPNSTYGKTSILYAGNSYDHAQDIWGSERIYVRFNISDVPKDQVILQATLKLWQYYAPASEQTYEAHRVLEDWVEKTQSWNTQPRWAAEKTSETIAPPNTEVAVEWDITDDVQGWYSGQLRNYGTMIKVAEEGHVRDASSGFWSREYPVEDLQPKLTILLQRISPPEYVATVSVRGLPYGVNSTIALDGRVYGSISLGFDEEIPFDKGGIHVISVTDIISVSSGVRYRCEDNETQFSDGGLIVFTYVVEYMVRFLTEPSDLFETPPSGWYANGTVLEVKRLGEDFIVIASLTHLAFDGWYSGSQKIEEPPGCSTCPGSDPTTIVVSQALDVVGRYRTEYYLNVTSPMGETEGSGWYPKDSTAHFSLDTTEIPADGLLGWFGMKRVFAGWVGSQNFLGLPREPQGAVVMKGPTNLDAVWEDDWGTFTTNVVALLVVMICGIVAILMLKKRIRAIAADR